MNKNKSIITLASLLLLVPSIISCNQSSNKKEEKEEITPTFILSDSSKELYIGETFKLNYLLKNYDGVPSFVSSNVEIVTVSSDGVVTAKKAGTAIVVATVGNINQNCTFTVLATPTYHIESTTNEITLITGHTYQLEACLYAMYDQKIDDAVISYTSMDDSIATVSNTGLISGISCGKTEIILSSTYKEETYYSYVSIKVNPEAYFEVETYQKLNLVKDGKLTKEHTIDYKIKKFDNTEIEGAKATIDISDTSIISLVSDNKVIINKCGSTTVTLSYEGIETTIDVDAVIDGHLKDEYKALLDDSQMDDVELWTSNQRGTSSAIGTAEPAKIIHEDFGDKFDGQPKMMINSAAAKGQVKYLGVYMTSQQTKEELIALSNEGYKSLQINYYWDSQDNSLATGGGVFIGTMNYTYAENRNRVDHKMITESNAKTWLTLNIPLEDEVRGGITLKGIISNYDKLQSKEIQLFAHNTELNNFNYTLYIAPLMFVK